MDITPEMVLDQAVSSQTPEELAHFASTVISYLSGACCGMAGWNGERVMMALESGARCVSSD